ncbi:sulfotransferase 6B1-like [Physella acuta]|uniref:sulfotransferase 6B1-like n=1 Tax=Physella acuta TaxID=109671 RepID=UPI0027DBB2DE|nr:sulfotransferase 6B1-like [Physella acuta]
MNIDQLDFSSNKSVFDADGQELKLLALGDKLLPCFGEGNFTKVKDIEIRDDDVVLVGYPKTGCHWTWEVLNLMLNQHSDLTALSKLAGFLEVASGEFMARTPGPRVLNSHLWFNSLPRQVAEKKTKLILTVRNPKDTAVSYYNHALSMQWIHGYKGTFNSWLQLYLDGLGDSVGLEYGSYFDYYLDWDQVIKANPRQPVLVVYYENMKKDLPREVRRLAKYLGLSLSDNHIDRIARVAEFDAMKQDFVDRNHISLRHLRKGQVGDWKNWLTVAQSEAIDEEMKKLDGTRFADQIYVL